MRIGTADLPLHGGKAPRWLFERMTFAGARDGAGDPLGGRAPVDRPTYDATIESLRRAVTEAKAGHSEKSAALKRLAGVERSLTAAS